jgi:hypothetical protein
MFSSTKKIRVDKNLYLRLQAKAQEAGYSSTDEYITHVLESAATGSDEPSDREQIDRQLRGLGYLDSPTRTDP